MEVASGRSLPGVFFFYDLSPIKVTINGKRRPVLPLWKYMLYILIPSHEGTCFLLPHPQHSCFRQSFRPMSASVNKQVLDDAALGLCSVESGIGRIQYKFCFMQVKFTEQRQSFLHFVTNVCAIVGGEELEDTWF